jgi:hypothetical protein
VSSRPLAAALIATAVAALAVTWGVGRDAAPVRDGTPAVADRDPEAEPSPLPRVDPRGLRDVFRFADEPAAPVRAEAERGTRPTGDATPAPGPRLVGLLWRGERLLAVLSIDGEVRVAGPGETVAGTTVVSVNGEAVRIRLPDGKEESLTPP